MWDQRLPYRTGAEGVYLCGAGTHPGGSVIAVNGRNAALAVLADWCKLLRAEFPATDREAGDPKVAWGESGLVPG